MRSEKQLLLDEIEDKIGSFGSFVIAGYEKMTANLANDFRAEIANTGGDVEIVKKRLFVKAAEDKGVSFQVQQLPGHIALIFAGQDPLATIKMLYKFGKESEVNFQVLGGRFEEQVLSGTDMEELSKLPGKDEMRAQFLATLEAPQREVVSLFDALLTSVMHCIENKMKNEDSDSSSN